MGKLIDGVWQDIWYDTKSHGGKFMREDAGFRDWIEPAASAKFAAESGRYHLYVSLACPWAHRTLIFRELKQLQDHIDVTIVCPDMLNQGWTFGIPEPLHGYRRLHELYTHAKPDYTGRVTVPVLWDKKLDTIVSNESSEIIRMFNSAFNQITDNHLDFYPEFLHSKINEWNDFIYESINNGVYRCGFATTQPAYEAAYKQLFAALDKIDAHLKYSRYLCGDQLTEADWRLYTTLVRFDAVYFGHFKCNKKRIADYVHLQNYLRELYQMPAAHATTDFYHIKRHYYFSHKQINPTQIVPAGPELSLDLPHHRDEMKKSS